MPIGRRRLTRRRRARRWGRVRAALLALVGLLLVGGLVWLVFFSSVLAVAGVQVRGTDVLAAEQVRTASDVPTGEPLATVDLEAVAARVESLAPVARVEVAREWPDRVRVVVAEREAVAVVPTARGLRGVDAEGVLFRDYARRPRTLPLLRDETPAGEATPALAEAARVVVALPDRVAARTDYVSVRTVDTILLRLRSGRTVRWGSASQSQDKARVLEVLLDQPATAYDVSVPGRPVIRP